MSWWGSKPRKSARALIIKDGKLLTFHRKRHSRKTGEWIEYYSIPGGGIDPGETPEQAVVRELQEEMGVVIELERLLAHRLSPKYEHYIFAASIVDGEPQLRLDSEEAKAMHEFNQFIVRWVEVDELSAENLRYYGDYLELIRQLRDGTLPEEVLRISAS